MKRTVMRLRAARLGWLVGLIAVATCAALPAMTLGQVPEPDADLAPGAPPAPETEAPPVSEPVEPSADAPEDAEAAPPRFRPLRLGALGLDVKNLQRELRRRKHRIGVDGAFGPQTKRAVTRQQRRFAMTPTGRASVRLQRRLRLKPSWRPTQAAPPQAPQPALTPRSVPVGNLYVREFPVRGEYTYMDDFGAPRHQGRHEGIDIMADSGTPVIAVTDGTVLRMTRAARGLGGIWLWQQDEQGNTFYYAHLSSVAPGLEPGSVLRVGQEVGGVGNTGDASGGASHLHFEVHPGDGAAINPFAELVAVDPARAEAGAS